MTTYQTILNLGDNLLLLMNKSIIPITVLDYKVYYEAYLQQVEIQSGKDKKIKKIDIVSTVAENFKVSERLIYKVIAFMEK